MALFVFSSPNGLRQDSLYIFKMLKIKVFFPLFHKSFSYENYQPFHYFSREKSYIETTKSFKGCFKITRIDIKIVYL